jgi:hypothetical protein
LVLTVRQVQAVQAVAEIPRALVHQIGILPLVEQAEHMVILAAPALFLLAGQHHCPQHKILPVEVAAAQVAPAVVVLGLQVQVAKAELVQSGPTLALLYFTPAAVVVVPSNRQALLIQALTDQVQVIMAEG